MADNVNELNLLNNDMSLDFLHQYNQIYIDQDRETDPYMNRNLNCQFHNMSALSSIPNAEIMPIYLSVNIQSLNSKFEQLKEQILDLQNQNLKVDAIAIQETWEIKYPDTLTIPGF